MSKADDLTAMRALREFEGQDFELHRQDTGNLSDQPHCRWMARKIKNRDHTDGQPTFAKDPADAILGCLGRPEPIPAAEIDKMAEESVEFPIRKFYGLEFRGLLGDVIDDVQIEKQDDGSLKVKVVLLATCVRTGVSQREVILETPVRVDPDPNPVVNGVELTDEQVAIKGCIRFLLLHELTEDLRLDGAEVFNENIDHKFDKAQRFPK